MTFNLIVTAALAYGALLFAIAFFADRYAAKNGGRWLRSPWLYTLSLSVYCTAWTFYGAVGYAARSGLEFLTIYLGPSLVMIGWWALLRRLVKVAHQHRVTSIADLISARYGKSALLGVMVTGLAVLATTPYIALQLQSVTLSLAVFARADGAVWADGQVASAAFWVAAGLVVFAVLFGTRNVHANERHHGVVMAIAAEAVVKLVALAAVGAFVVWGLADGIGDIMARIDASPIARDPQSGSRWGGLTAVSAMAFLTLPRMFQVLVVENVDEGHLITASWAFPAYMMAMSLFVVPIAVVGLEVLPASANPDLFVLSLPLHAEQYGLAMLAFLGGFSSATSMVVVATIALATMVANHAILPVWLSVTPQGAAISGDIRRTVLVARRLSIAAVLGLGYLYYRLSGGGVALASIGLISFTGIAQIGPVLIAGLFWRGATRTGAAAGLAAGFVFWVWCLLLPSVGAGGLLPETVLQNGPYGIAWLRPEAMFGAVDMDPVVHALLWSWAANVIGLIIGSMLTRAAPLERLVAAQFTAPATFASQSVHRAGSTSADELMIMSQRVIGAGEAQQLFAEEAALQGAPDRMPQVTPDLLDKLERKMAGAVGAATAHAMVGQISGEAGVSVEDMLALADEAAQILDYSNRLEAKSAEQEATAQALREANAKLLAIGRQKDAFLSQISHELRTPMTAIRSMSEVMTEGPEALAPADQERFAQIIYSETERLTRLLDDLLDLSVLENSAMPLNVAEIRMADLLDQAQSAAQTATERISISVDLPPDLRLLTDSDRLLQVMINLINNAAKYGADHDPELRISAGRDAGQVWIEFADNGPGIPDDQKELVFEKFARLSDSRKAGGAGLGLAICREIMTRLGGRISLRDGHPGAVFRLELPDPR